MAGTITTVIRALFQSQGADKVAQDINKVGKAGEEVSKKQTRLGNESTNTGRAFSSQASGLGGLVAAYAGAAATTFALQQAFATLKSVAEFAQVIDGTRNLAASLGQSGDVILTNIQTITKGQLALKEAATVANLALSSGFSTDQISKLSGVATTASRALGRDLTDSFNRLIRGAAKLEPELLDELGIFTRIEPAVEAYAAKIGRSANSLTEAERRQAFLNAVIDEGTRKFSRINTSTETSAEVYNRLGATLSDLGNKLGGFVADVLAPIASFFSKGIGNSLALFLVILAITFSKASSLLKTFLDDSSKKLADFGGTVAKRIAGPGFEQKLAPISQAFEKVSLVGFTKLEQGFAKAIKEGTLQPQQIAAAQDALRGFIDRKESQRGKTDKTEAVRVAQIQAAKSALKDLPGIEDAAGNAAVTAGKAFEKFANTLSVVATRVALIISRFSVFIALVTAVQLLGEVLLGVDILGSIFNYFEKLRDNAKKSTEIINDVTNSISKEVKIKIGVEVSKKGLEEGSKAANEYIESAVKGIGFGDVFSELLKRNFLNAGANFIKTTVGSLASITTDPLLKLFGTDVDKQKFAADLNTIRSNISISLDLDKESKQAALAIVNNFIEAFNRGDLTRELYFQILKGVQKAGGAAEDYIKTLKLTPQFSQLPGLTPQGKVKFAGGTEIELADETFGSIASSAVLTTSKILEFNEELSRGPITASQAGEKLVAISSRIKEQEVALSKVRLNAVNTSNEEDIIKAAQVQKSLELLKIEERYLSVITAGLVKQEALIKFLDKAFTSERELGQDIDFSGIFKNGKLAESELEQYTNRVELFNKALSQNRFEQFYSKALVSTGGLRDFQSRIQEVSDDLIVLNKQIEEAGRLRTPIGGEEFGVTVPGSPTITAVDKQTELQKTLLTLRQREAVLQNQSTQDIKSMTEEYSKITVLSKQNIGSMLKQSLFAADLLKNEKKRKEEYLEQIKVLLDQLELLKLQNEVSRLQAQGEKEQRSGQILIRQDEARLALLKAQDDDAKSRLDILNKQIEREKVRADLLFTENQLTIQIGTARAKVAKEAELSRLALKQTVADILPGIGGEAFRIEIDRDAAIKNYELQAIQLSERKALIEEEARNAEEDINRRSRFIRAEIESLNTRQTFFDGQIQKEGEIIKARRDLEDKKLKNERDILLAQNAVADAQALADKTRADADEKKRTIELDLLDSQIKLLERQQQVYDSFIKGLNQAAINFGRALGLDPTELQALQREQREYNETATNVNKVFSDRIKELQNTLTISRNASGTIAQTQKTIADEQRSGVLAANNLRKEGIDAEIAGLTRLRQLEDEIRDNEIKIKKAERQDEKDAAEGRRRNLIIERSNLNSKLLKDRLDLLGDENKNTETLIKAVVTAQLKSSAFVRAINDISRGIQDNLDTAVRNFFKTINEGVKPTQALTKSLKEFGVASLETIQQGLAKQFITAPLQEFVGGFFEGLLGGLGFVTPRSADTVLSNVYDPATRSLRISTGPLAQLQQGITGNAFANLGNSLGNVIGAPLASIGNSIKGFFSSGPTGGQLTQSYATMGGAGLESGIMAIGGPVKHMAAGGYAGLRDRVPALLEPGEFVIRRPAAMAIGGQTLNQMNATGQTAPGNVMVNVNNQGTSQEVVGTPKVSMNGRDMIVDIVVRDIQNNGPIRKTLRGM